MYCNICKIFSILSFLERKTSKQLLDSDIRIRYHNKSSFRWFLVSINIALNEVYLYCTIKYRV